MKYANEDLSIPKASNSLKSKEREVEEIETYLKLIYILKEEIQIKPHLDKIMFKV